ncbi:MAG: hypothetical protein BYD32DRAFT_453102 [Podila humilis]|nr:MAG: hypothetical protein BYD32DRAFT_453102 [Podila humilis]
MASPLTSNNNDTSTSLAIPSSLNTTQPPAQNTDAMRPQSYFKSTVQYSSAIALGQTIYILSVFLSLAQFVVVHAQVMLSQDQKRLTENTSPEKALSSQSAVTDKGTLSLSSSTTITTPIIRERYSSRIKRALVKTLSGNFAPVALKRVTFDDEAIVEDCNEDQPRPKRISEEGTFAASPTAASPPNSPTGPGVYVRNKSLTHQQASPAQPLTKKLDQIQMQQRTQPKIKAANATTIATKKSSLPIFSLSSKSTTPSIAGGLRGINAIGSLGVAPETKSTTTVASVSSITNKNNNYEEHGLRRSTSAPSKNSPALRRNMERENVTQSTVAPTESLIQEAAPVEVSERMNLSFLVTETLVPDVVVSAYSPVLAPTYRPDTPSLFEAPGSIDVMAKKEPPTSRNSLLVTSLGTRARRSLSLVRQRPSSILGEEDRKELVERNRRRSSVQLELPPNFVTTPSLSKGSAMERQGSVEKSAGKSFLYKIAHPQRYKREQQEEMQKRSLSPSSPLANSEIQTREQASIKEAVVVDDSSSIRSLPSSSPPPAPQQQPRPVTPQPQATHFPSWPEYADSLDSSETVHSALYFPLSQPASRAPDASLAAMPPPLPPSSARSSLLRRSKIFMDKADEDDHTSFAAFGHPSPSLTPSDTVSTRSSFFARPSSTASSEVSTPASTPSLSPRTSLSIHGSRAVSSGSSSSKAGFGIAAALAGATGVSTAMVGVARPDDRKAAFDDSASEHSVASSMQSGDELRGRSGDVKKLGKK